MAILLSCGFRYGIAMVLALLAIVVGLVLLVWSADRFIEGAAVTARYAGMPSLVIGMVIVGFGTSAPEMVVSAMAALDGNPALALGNALGSNIVNTGLIIGITALLAPIAVNSNIVKRELPLLLAISLVFGYFLYDRSISLLESLVLLGGFFLLVGWTLITALNSRGDVLENEVNKELTAHSIPLARAVLWLLVGLVVLLISSRMLVWGSVTIAAALGVSNLVIGLTIVALGTSLPELAASVMAVRKNEHDIAIGNVVGSNMFNLLAVVGIAGSIKPMTNIQSEVFTRDWPLMMVLTVALFLMAYGFGKQSKISRWEGTVLLVIFFAYNTYLVATVI